ncbi:hypothetical protein [Teichococcus vastitatis]|uniref:hypothetical protein n=1 Tax=Teichococcus vastitatis TaxID=2307076 RepID=UPI0013002CED|nr:hypothetical protein [Pseudoroseomonas vastitatis]
MAPLLGPAAAQGGPSGTVPIPAPAGGLPIQQRDAVQRRSVEADGIGRTEADARSAAVGAALEEVVGAYLQSSRQLELRQQGSEVSETFNERIVAQSNGFVERVATLRSWHDGDNVRVRIRADVVVNRLVEAMREARMPLIALDQASLVATLQTQTARDDGARQLLAQYLRDLPDNVAARLEGMSTSIMPADPNTVSITGSIVFAISPHYVERGRALMREVAQEWRDPGRQDALVLCDAPAATNLDHVRDPHRNLRCAGVGLSRELAAGLLLEDRDAFLIGEGLYALADPRSRARMGGGSYSAGMQILLQVVDAEGRLIMEGGSRLSTDCGRLPFMTQAGTLNAFLNGGHRRQQGGRVAAEMTLAVLGTSESPKAAAVPATCVSSGARILGNPRLGEVRRAFVALLPRRALEQGAGLRISLAWTP